ncbi:MAG: dephospho-CoA kinase, partial [Burkholderiales bacterium]|nr:dephospho-CoA kinase [Burkholderiales bacterium]
VFADISAKLKLENILHPLIRLETEKAEQTAKGAYLIFVVPLLVESGNWKNRVNRTLVVDCTEKTQVQRVMLRNGMTEVEVKAIMNNQASRKQRLEAADDVIFNEGELTGIQEQVLRLHQMYLTMAEQL